MITASRALRDSPTVRPATRARVVAAASALRYTPNLLAKGLVEQRSKTIGVILTELANPFFGPIIRAIEAAAARQGYLAILGESGRDLETERMLVERFRQFRVAGIVIHPSSRRMGHLSSARLGGTPVIAVVRGWPGGDSIAVDNPSGGAQVAQHLLRRGHRRIGLLTSENAENLPVQERADGFLRGLAEQGVTIPERWHLRVDGTSFDEGRAAADRILAAADRPTAVFCVTDRLALGLINRLLEAGTRVPDDLAVIGFDDVPYSAYSQVPLTTVALPVEEMGAMAADLLFARMAKAAVAAPAETLKPLLVLRQSCP